MIAKFAVRTAAALSLVAGMAGMVYQLLRMDPACELPSVLIFDGR